MSPAGGGFLGGAIVRRLLARGDTVRSLARGDYTALSRLGVECLRGDLADEGAVRRAVAGSDLVFHVAAKAGIWGDFDDYHRANVVGTRHVIAACRVAGVPKLIYTSSPSVVFDGRDMENADESVPYPEHHDAPYPATKATAERAVLAANSPQLAVVALRPHLIWGPGDNHLVPRIIARAKAGRLRRIGVLTKRVDATHVDNAADAHLLAADRLAAGNAVAGKVYFIANGEPMPIWDLVNGILDAAGLPPVLKTIPTWAALAAGLACEGVYKTLRLAGEPPMTRFLARELATSHWFNLSAARRDLDYAPRTSIAEGLRGLRASLRSSS